MDWLIVSLFSIGVVALFYYRLSRTTKAERERLRLQLLQAQKMETVGRLAGGLAHDLNDQLTPIIGYLDLVLSQTTPDSPVYPLLSEANAAAKRCAQVVQTLLDSLR